MHSALSFPFVPNDIILCFLRVRKFEINLDTHDQGDQIRQFIGLWATF